MNSRLEELKNIGCTSTFKSVYIHTNGQVSGCCLVWLNKDFGNIKNTSLIDILNGSVAKDIRQTTKDGSFKYCNKQLCPALNSFLSTGVKNFLFVGKDQIADWQPDQVRKGERIELFLNYDPSCNLACPSCRNETIIYKLDSYPKEILDVHERVVEGIKDLIALDHHVALNITGSGDAFASQLFWNIICDKNFYNKLELRIQTNGTLMTPEKLEEINIQSNATHLQVSVDAFTEETYKLVRVNGNFKKLQKNISDLDEMISSNKFQKLHGFKLNFVVQKTNYKEMREFAKWALSFKNIEIVWFNLISDWGHFPQGKFAELAIWNTKHPDHSDFLDILKDPIFSNPKIDMGNLSAFCSFENG